MYPEYLLGADTIGEEGRDLDPEYSWVAGEAGPGGRARLYRRGGSRGARSTRGHGRSSTGGRKKRSPSKRPGSGSKNSPSTPKVRV